MKRVFDCIFSLFAGLVLSPILVLIASLIRIEMGSPVIYVQQRPGLNGRIFSIYKFRTMAYIQDENGNKLSDDVRLTRLGKILRRTSLDELPELWNVIRGDMSLVGPRPLLVEYLKRYTPEQMRRHEMKPGITGWAQVNGRNSITWEEKFNLDIWYVDHWSLLLDLKIIGMTLWKIIKREGISQAGHATMEEFKGNNYET